MFFGTRKYLKPQGVKTRIETRRKTESLIYQMNGQISIAHALNGITIFQCDFRITSFYAFSLTCHIRTRNCSTRDHQHAGLR